MLKTAARVAFAIRASLGEGFNVGYSRPFVGQLASLGRALNISMTSLLELPAAELLFWQRFGEKIESASAEVMQKRWQADQ